MPQYSTRALKIALAKIQKRQNLQINNLTGQNNLGMGNGTLGVHDLMFMQTYIG